jgi:uncharacterized protein
MKIVRSARLVPLALFAGLLLDHTAAHATSFDCNKGRSVPEQLICHTGDLSKLDDQLGKLYWQARRRVDNPKAFRADSDSKWAWRETNCRDEACLKTWYSGRIEELQQLLASLPGGRRAAAVPASVSPDTAGASEPAAPPLPALPADAGRRAFVEDDGGGRREQVAAKAVAKASANTIATAKSAAPMRTFASATAPLQCTAAEPGIALNEQCSTVLKQDARWQYPPHSGDWFCGVATVAQTPAPAAAQ